MREKYCSLELSKKLKELGFDFHVNSYYELNSKKPNSVDVLFTEIITNYNSPIFHSTVSRPQYWQVADWIEINFGYLTITEPAFIIENDWSSPAYKTIFKNFYKNTVDNVPICKEKIQSIELSTLQLLETHIPTHSLCL